MEFSNFRRRYIPFDSIFKILNDKNNQSPLAVEVEFTADGVKNVEEVDEAIQKSADYLKAKGLNLKGK